MIRHTAREQRQAAVRKLAEAVSSFVYEQSNAARNARADMIRASHLKSVKHHLAAHSAARAQRYYNAYVTVWANYADKIAARANGFGTPVTRMPDDRRGREACGATFCRVLAQAALLRRRLTKVRSCGSSQRGRSSFPSRAGLLTWMRHSYSSRRWTRPRSGTTTIRTPWPAS